MAMATQLDLLRPKTKKANAVTVTMDLVLALDLRDLAKKLGGVPMTEIMRVAARALVIAGRRIPDGATIFDLKKEMQL